MLNVIKKSSSILLLAILFFSSIVYADDYFIPQTITCTDKGCPAVNLAYVEIGPTTPSPGTYSLISNPISFECDVWRCSLINAIYQNTDGDGTMISLSIGGVLGPNADQTNSNWRCDNGPTTTDCQCNSTNSNCPLTYNNHLKKHS